MLRPQTNSSSAWFWVFSVNPLSFRGYTTSQKQLNVSAVASDNMILSRPIAVVSVDISFAGDQATLIIMTINTISYCWYHISKKHMRRFWLLLNGYKGVGFQYIRQFTWKYDAIHGRVQGYWKFNQSPPDIWSTYTETVPYKKHHIIAFFIFFI